MSLVRRIARPMLASVFVVAGLDALRHPGSKTAAATPIAHAISGPLGLPDDPELLVRANGAAMIAGGGLLGLGRLPRLASAVLAGSFVPATLTAHAFWLETDPQKRADQRAHFVKNLALLGGVLLATVDTDGKPGLAYRAKLLGQAAERTAGTVKKDTWYAARAARREALLKVAQAT